MISQPEPPNLEIKPAAATLGAMVTDVDLAHLDDATWEEIETAFYDFAVLIFPGQNLSDEEQVVFGARFGAFEQISPDPEKKLVYISNVREDGSVVDPDHAKLKFLRGNEGWHTDSSYMAVSAKASVLSAVTLPSSGGATEWADMRAAYDALTPEMSVRLEGLSAYHSILHSQAKMGHEAPVSNAYGMSGEDPPLRPLIKIHPVTGRPALFIGRHAYGIPTLKSHDSERLLEELLKFACKPPRVYHHDWKPGDVVVWDNRCVLHRAMSYDYSQPRVMRHVRISGDPVTEYAASA